MDENIRFIHTQVEMAKRMNVVAIPSALIRGKVDEDVIILMDRLKLV